MQQDIGISERRIAARFDFDRPVAITGDAGTRDARTVNISASGVLVTTAEELTIWTELAVALPAIGERAARVVRRDGARYGLVFREPLSAVEFSGVTGMTIVEEPVVEIVADAAPAPRVAPWAFGRDKIKSFRRRAAEHAQPGRR